MGTAHEIKHAIAKGQREPATRGGTECCLWKRTNRKHIIGMGCTTDLYPLLRGSKPVLRFLAQCGRDQHGCSRWSESLAEPRSKFEIVEQRFFAINLLPSGLNDGARRALPKHLKVAQ